jgi:hypothetical protein
LPSSNTESCNRCRHDKNAKKAHTKLAVSKG